MPNEVAEFFEQILPAKRQEEAIKLDAFFREVTGWNPELWKGGMVGYGRYDYTYETGRTGTWFATGFAPRAPKLSIHIMPGYADFSDILERLGKHTIGKSCLYLNKLSDADMDVLGELVRAGLTDLEGYWPVRGT